MQLNLTSATRMGLNALALLGVAVALRLGESIFIPLTFAVLLAAILWPVADWLHRRRLPWSIACMVAVSLLLLVFIAVTVGFAVAVPRMLQDLPINDQEAQAKQYKEFREKVQSISPGRVDAVLPEDPEQSQLLKSVREAFKSENMSRVLWQLSGYFGTYLLELVLIMFIVLFLLMEGKMLTQRVVEIFGPSEEDQARAVGVLAEIAQSVRTYLVWRTLVNVGLGLVLGGVYQAIELKHPWTWALVAAILCYVPYIGTIIAGVPPVLDAFVTLGPWGALGVLIFYVAVVTFEGYVIIPVVMGRSMELNAVTVLLACLFWDLVWGTPGLFLAMPLMAALKSVCMSVPGWRPWANLMGTDDGPVPIEPAAAALAPSPLPASIDPDKTLLLEEPTVPFKSGPPPAS